MVKQLAHPDWVRRFNLFGAAAGDARAVVDLDPDALLAVAQANTGLSDLGEVEWPGWAETYRRHLAAIDAESELHLLGRVVTRVPKYSAWCRPGCGCSSTGATRPALAHERIDAPLFVVGPPRTGTTILLELLALDPPLRAPLAWEALHPLPVAEDPGLDRARRREFAECEQEFWSDMHPEFMTMHELASDLPCECVHFLAYDFAGPALVDALRHAAFTGWQLEHIESLDRVYRLHRRMLQTFQHGSEPRRWLLKSPGHLQTLAQVFAEYPDAKVIHTHRDPREVHRVAREPAGGAAVHAQRPRRRRRARSADGADVSDVPRAGDRPARATARSRRRRSSTATSST